MQGVVVLAAGDSRAAKHERKRAELLQKFARKRAKLVGEYDTKRLTSGDNTGRGPEGFYSPRPSTKDRSKEMERHRRGFAERKPGLENEGKTGRRDQGRLERFEQRQLQTAPHSLPGAAHPKTKSESMQTIVLVIFIS